MAVIDVSEIHDGRDGEKASGKNRIERRYTRVWMVTTNSRYDEASVIYASLPAIGSVYPSDSATRLVKLNPRGDKKSKFVWWVTGQYQRSDIAENPIDDPIQIDWKTKPFQRPYTKDRDGAAILNSAGDPYDPPIEGDDAMWQVNVVRNLTAVPSWILAYRNAVNADAFTVDGIEVAVGCGKLAGVSISKVERRNDTTYRAVQFTIEVKDSPWTKEELDAGFNEIVLDPVSEEIVKLPITQRGKRVTSPALLNGSGIALTNPTPATAVYRSHNIYPSLPFSILLT